MAVHIVDQHTADSGSSAPQIMSGNGIPAFAAPAGSIFIRTDGAGGTRIYVSQNGAGTWLAIATV